jgi:hypothetical protein
MLGRSNSPARRPTGFIEPCLPILGHDVPTGRSAPTKSSTTGFGSPVGAKARGARVLAQPECPCSDKVDRMSPDAQTVRDIGAAAFQDAIEILVVIATLEAGNKPSVFQKAQQAGYHRVVDCIYRALWSRLLGVVGRAYAINTRPGDLHAQYAFDLLKDSQTRSFVETTPPGDATALAEAINLWTKCRSDHRCGPVLKMRDKQIAHWSLVRTPPPIANDIIGFGVATARALEKLAQGSGAVSLSLDSQLVGYRQEAERLWDSV